MPHGNAQGAGLCVLSHETCMAPLTSTHKHPTYWPERRHRTHPRPLTGSRSRAARPRARQPRTPRAACRTPCALPQRSRPGPPPGTTSHGAQRPRTDGHTRTTYRARRACPCDRARARRALRAMRRTRRRLWPAHRAPTTPPLIDLPEAGRLGGATPNTKMRSTAADRGSAAVERRGWRRAPDEGVRASRGCSANAAYLLRPLETENMLDDARMSCR